jgi:hypothetical protein
MPPREIVKHYDVIAPYLKHDEWWLRTGAFLAICKTGAEAAPLVPNLIDCFVREQHGWTREFYHRQLKTLLREDQPPLSDEVRKQVLVLLGDDFAGGRFPRDHAYTMRGNWFYEHRSSHILTSFAPDQLVLVADQVNQVLANMGDPELVKDKETGAAFWILNGDKWGGEGLLNIIAQVNEQDRAAFMPGLKALLAGGLDVLVGSGKKAKNNAEPLQQAKDKARALLEPYERKHGKVQPYPARAIDYAGS